MSCGCSNKLSHLPNCPQGITAPTINCQEGEPCETVYTAECVIYTGPAIPCYNIVPGDRISEIIEKLIAAAFSPCTSTTSTTILPTTTSSTTTVPTTSSTTVAPTTTTTLTPISTTTLAPTTTSTSTTLLPATTSTSTSTSTSTTTLTPTTSTTTSLPITTTIAPTTTTTTTTVLPTTTTTTEFVNPFTATPVVIAVAPGSICSGTCLLRYTVNGIVEEGAILYMPNGMPVTGFNYVSLCNAGIPSGLIYNLDPSTGAIGASTGVSC